GILFDTVKSMFLTKMATEWRHFCVGFLLCSLI
ncbi:hypothetical protein ACUXE6_002303, partial [Staphylococcus epidermidis]